MHTSIHPNIQHEYHTNIGKVIPILPPASLPTLRLCKLMQGCDWPRGELFPPTRPATVTPGFCFTVYFEDFTHSYTDTVLFIIIIRI